MSRFSLLALMPVCLLFCAPDASAIYKCESAGKIVYSDTPCGNGARQRTVDTSDAVVDPANAAQARVRAERERVQLEQFAKQQDQQQIESDKNNAAARQRTAQVEQRQRQRCEKLSDDKQRSADEVIAAKPAQLLKAQLSARRADEKYRTACAPRR